MSSEQSVSKTQWASLSPTVHCPPSSVHRPHFTVPLATPLPNDAPALVIAGIGHRYGKRTALDGVSFEVARGERFGLLGPNGGGKTTLLRSVCTLLKPTVGSVRVFGLDPVTEPSAVRRHLGVVFQSPALDADLTVRENLAIHGALVGIRGEALVERKVALLDLFGLADRAGDRVRTLSGGLVRRADLVRGLLHRPPLLLLDEPTVGLDPLARRELWDALDAGRRTDGTTQVVATHLMEEAELCDRVGIIDRGRLVAIGAPAELRAALGTETLWLEGPEPARLAALVSEKLGVAARTVGRRVLVDSTAPAHLLPALHDAAGDLLAGASLHRPTLEDVFLAATGRTIGDG